MIKDYKKTKVLDPPNDKCYLYLAENTTKNEQCYMYELHEGDQFEQQFKLMKKFIGSPHILQLQDIFDHESSVYYITQRPKPTLQKHQSSLPSKFFQLQQAMNIFSQILSGLLQIHKLSYVYLGIQPSFLKYLDGTVKLSHFSNIMRLSKAQKLQSLTSKLDEKFLPPEGFTEMKVGNKSDFWMLGVTFYYMLNGEYPFEDREDVKKKCGKEGGFDYRVEVEKSKYRNLGAITPQVCEFFKRVFAYQVEYRLTENGMKTFAKISKYFSDQTLTFINEQQMEQSAIRSQIKDKNQNFFYQYLEIQLEAINLLEVNSSQIYTDLIKILQQPMRLALRYALLKVALVKLEEATSLMESQEAAQFKTNKEFIIFKENYQKPKKILQMQFKAVNLQLQNGEKVSIQAKRLLGDLYGQTIPSTFGQIKRSFRSLTSKIFSTESVKYRKYKDEIANNRKRLEMLVKVTIFHLINRIFQENQRESNLKIYYKWHKGKGIEGINTWIKESSDETLTDFIKFISQKYLG